MEAVDSETAKEGLESTADGNTQQAPQARQAISDFVFVVVVILLVDILYRLFASPTEYSLPALQEFEAMMVFRIHEFLGHPVELSYEKGHLVALTFRDDALQYDLKYYISDDCTGMHELVFLASMILPFRSIPLKNRLRGLAVALPLMFVLNMGRLLMLYPLAVAIGNSGMWRWHWLIWKYGQLIIVLMIFLVWFYLAGWRSTVQALSGLSADSVADDSETGPSEEEESEDQVSEPEVSEEEASKEEASKEEASEEEVSEEEE